MTRGLLAAAIAITLASTAHAAPLHVQALRCPVLDQAALDVAVAHELGQDPRLELRARDVEISLECRDDLRASVRLEPDLADGPVARDVELGDVPASLRVKLVALAIVELVAVVDAAKSAAPPSRPVASAAPTPSDDEAPPRITAKPAASFGPKIAVRTGVRMFADDQYTMANISTDLEFGPVQIGLNASLGEGHRFTGIPYIVAASVAHRLVCSDGRTSLCLHARGELGFAGVSIYEDSMANVSHSVHSVYGGLALGFEVSRQFTGWKGLAGIEIGAADGLVVMAQSFVHLDGPFATTSLGVQW